MILFIKINFLFNQMIIEIDTHKIDEIKSKKKKLARLHLLEIISKNNFFKNKFQLYKIYKKIIVEFE